MTLHSFVIGERIQIGSEIFLLRRMVSEGLWQLENEKTGELIIMEERDLRQLYFESRARFIEAFVNEEENLDEVVDEKIEKNFTDYPESVRNEAKRRLSYVRAFQNANPSNPSNKIKEIANKLGESAPPSLPTIQKWSKTFNSSFGDICSLIPNYKNRGNRRPRYSQEVVNIALYEVENVYLKLERKSIEATLSAVRHTIDRENLRRTEAEKLPKPGRKLIRNIINGIDAYDIMLSRYGKNAANRHFRETLTTGEIIEEPLIRVEIDHTVLDLIVVSSETYLPLGRPTLTVALDRCTRCLLGYHVGFDPPSYVSVMKCLSHAIKPKDYVSTRYPDVQKTWPCWGIPIMIVCDNGKEFHSKDFEAAALSLLMELRFNPVRQPWWKGAVERFFGKLNKSLIHTLPGTTFSNVREKSEYQSLKQAIVTEDELHRLLHIWICDIYHQTRNRNSLRTPFLHWREKIDPAKQKLPSSTKVLDISLSSTEVRSVFGYGIELNNLRYNSKGLQRIIRKNGKTKVTVKWDKSNIGHIFVLDDDANNYIQVPCTWLRYAEGLSLWLHRLIRKEIISKSGYENEAELDAAKKKILDICMQTLKIKRLMTRKTAARMEQSAGDNALEYEEPVIEHVDETAPIASQIDSHQQETSEQESDEDEDEVLLAFDLIERGEKNGN